MNPGVSAILLAAGESRRMGTINKLTLPVDGTPLLQRTVRMLLDASLEELVVVLGHEAEVVAPLLSDLPVETVINAHYREGQMGSVHCGMKALRQPCAGVMVCLTDRPLLETADIDSLPNAFVNECPRSVLVPVFQGRRGNPIVLAHKHRETILTGDRNLGCKRLIEKNPELVWPFEMPNDHCVFDLDTPQDYTRLLERTLGARQVSNL